jgi:hypothetical protein
MNEKILKNLLIYPACLTKLQRSKGDFSLRQGFGRHAG